MRVKLTHSHHTLTETGFVVLSVSNVAARVICENTRKKCQQANGSIWEVKALAE